MGVLASPRASAVWAWVGELERWREREGGKEKEREGGRGGERYH